MSQCGAKMGQCGAHAGPRCAKMRQCGAKVSQDAPMWFPHKRELDFDCPKAPQEAPEGGVSGTAAGRVATP